MSDTVQRLQRYRLDPWLFLTECCYTIDQVDSHDPVKSLPNREYAKYYIDLWQNCPLMAIPKSRRMTMSWFTIAIYLWDTLFHTGRFNAFVSKKEDDAAELVKRAVFILEHIPEDKWPKELRPEYITKFNLLEFPGIQSKIQGFPQGADQLRQFTFSGIFGDECAFWDHAKAFYSASFPTIEGGGRMTLVSSPAPGFFKQLVFDALDQPSDVNVADIRVNDHQLMQGMRSWRNKKNNFVVMELHYTADPQKRSDEFRESIKSAMPITEYLREYELHWDTFSGFPVFPEWSKLHITGQEPHPMHGLPMLVGIDFGLCYDDKTEVLTKAGWKYFKDVSDTEEVATLNPTTFELEYEVPKLKVDMPYSGKMIEYNGDAISFCVTPDHIMPIWYDKKDFRRYYAKDVNKHPRHKYLRLTANYTGVDSVNELGFDAITYAAFMGAFLSEGSLDKSHVKLHQTKDKTWMRLIVEKTGLKWADYGFCCYSTEFATKLAKYGLQDVRYIPECIKTGSRQAMMAFIDAYTMGAGHVRQRENGAIEHTIFSSSKRMVDDLSEIALKLGWHSSIRWQNGRDSYYAKIHGNGGWVITFKKRTSWAEPVRENFKEVDYSGRVYCLSVKNSILYVRKNGRPHWNGNTPAAIIAQYQEDRLIVFEELVEVNMGSDRFSEKLASLIKLRYRSHTDLATNWLCFIDPAGLQRNQKDETACAQSLTSVGFRVSPGPILWEQRRKGVVSFLKGMVPAGPTLQVYANGCPMLIKGFEGGYQYAEKSQENEPEKLRPLKNAYSHPHDAFQYLCCGIADTVSRFKRHVPIPRYTLNDRKDKQEEKRHARF